MSGAPYDAVMSDPRGVTAALTPLPRSFFEQEPLVVAPALLGTVFAHDVDGVRVAVRLTEVEAYLGEGEDPASHSYRGLRPRNTVMFGPPGHAYLYFTYGMHWCANVVCRPEGTSGGVLLRAGEVIEGLETARLRRPAARRDVDLARGPARLASALALAGQDNGRDLCNGGELQVFGGEPVPADQVRVGPRVGVTPAGAGSQWRYWVADEPTVSVYRPVATRRRLKTGGPQP
jgi:DNA-3-methyladenine glycosylase